MSEQDFDVDALAKYLHLTPQQVERLANRDKIPARRVAGQWRFSQAEIHHWMEERMGVLEDAELVKVENAMSPSTAEDELHLSDLLSVETIAIPLEARTKNAVIERMSELAAVTGMLWDPDRMADALRAREQLQSTAMDNGVAVLHPRRPMPSILGEPILALGISSSGIPFGGSRNLTDVFFLICSIDDKGHLRALARISRLLMNDSFVDELRHAADAATALDIIRTHEAQLDS